MRLGRRRLNVSRVSFRKIVKGGGVKSEMLMTLGGRAVYNEVCFAHFILGGSEF